MQDHAHETPSTLYTWALLVEHEACSTPKLYTELYKNQYIVLNEEMVIV